MGRWGWGSAHAGPTAAGETFAHPGSSQSAEARLKGELFLTTLAGRTNFHHDGCAGRPVRYVPDPSNSAPRQVVDGTSHITTVLTDIAHTDIYIF